MSSSVSLTNPPTSEARLGRALAGGLLWGGVMLLVLAAWLLVQESGPRWLAWLIGVVGLAALGLGAWEGSAAWMTKLRDDLVARRRVSALACIAGGFLLVVLAVVLEFAEGRFAPDRLGQAGGLFLLGLIAIGAGLHYRAGATAADVPVDAVRRRLPAIQAGLVLLGLVCIGAFIYLALIRKFGLALAPELFGLLALSMLAFGTVIWLFTQSASGLDATRLRALVLFAGGGAGLILFLVTLGRAWFWSNEVFLGGTSAWQGDNAWRPWLVVYAQLLALALVFGSLSLARADVRTNPLLRRLLYGYSTFAMSLLVLELLIVLNVIVYAMAPYTFQWSKSQGIYALSNSSKNLLASLKKEMHVYVLMSPDSGNYTDLKTLLDNAQAETNRLDVHYVSPDRDTATYTRLANLFPKILPDVRTARFGEAGRGILLVYGDMPETAKHNVKYAFITERKMTEEKGGDPHGGPPTVVFKGEGEIMREVSFLVRDQVRRKLYVLQGSGLPDVNEQFPGGRRDVNMGFDRIGIGVLADKLRKENYDVLGLSFELPTKKSENITYASETGPTKKKEVPEDAFALIVAGVSSPLPGDVVEAVGRYVDRGGKLLVFLDLVTNEDFTKIENTGLEPLLARQGVQVQPTFPLRVINNPEDVPTFLYAIPPDESGNLLARQFRRQVFYIAEGARSLASAPGTPFKTDVILQLDPRLKRLPYTTETDITVLRDPAKYQIESLADRAVLARVKEEFIPIALAVTENQGEKPRMVVFGDCDFITNLMLVRSPTREQSFSLVLSSLEWLASRETPAIVGLTPREVGTYRVPLLDADTVTRMVNVPGWMMLVTLFGIGTGIWLVRRR